MAVPAASSTALAGFYREHHGWLLGWLRRRTHNADCAADLTQDTFLRLLSRRVDPSELRLPRAYLSTIAHALLVNHWQRADLETRLSDRAGRTTGAGASLCGGAHAGAAAAACHR